MSDANRTLVELVMSGDLAEIRLVPPPRKPPTFDLEVLRELEDRIDEIAATRVRLVRLTSASEKFFCAGAHIGVLGGINSETIVPWVQEGHRVFNKLEDLPCPVVAVVSGYAMGGGLELAMACDLIFATENARFAQSEARLGFIPGWGGSRRLVERIGLARAKYLFYSSEIIDAGTAAKWGLADFAGTAGEVSGKLASLAENVLENNYNAVSVFKRIVNTEALDRRERNAEMEAVNSISCLLEEDTMARLRAFLNRKG